ncbi:hypothetical protein I4U23_015739 [Adineta vaga]|nr:hypothetical protein I4U23_015739 [Adineta vaga]
MTMRVKVRICDYSTRALTFFLPLHKTCTYFETSIESMEEEEEITTENGWLTACYSNELEVKELLFKIQTDHLDINEIIDNSGTGLLHICALRGYDQLLSYILYEFDNCSSINVNIIDKYGHTPLHWACLENNIECVNLLIKHSDINLNMRNFDALFLVDHQTPIYLIGGQTCLHFACEYGHIECVILLLEKMDMNSTMIKDFNGYTALDLAIMNSSRNDNCYDIVKLFNRFDIDKSTQILNQNDYFIQFYKDRLKVQKRTANRMKDTLPNMHGNCCHTCRKFYQIVADDSNEKQSD